MAPLYDELDVLNVSAGWFYPIDLSRRIGLAALAVFLYEYYVLQIILFLTMQFWTCVYILLAKPFDNRSVNAITLMNEVKLYFCCLLLGFAQANKLMKTELQEMQFANDIGWFVFYSELTFMAFNILYVLKVQVMTLVYKYNMRKTYLWFRNTKRKTAQLLRKAVMRPGQYLTRKTRACSERLSRLAQGRVTFHYTPFGSRKHSANTDFELADSQTSFVHSREPVKESVHNRAEESLAAKKSKFTFESIYDAKHRSV